MKRNRILILISFLVFVIISCQTISEVTRNTSTQVAEDFAPTLTALAGWLKLPNTPSLTRVPTQIVEGCSLERERYGFCVRATTTPVPATADIKTPTSTLYPYKKGELTIKSDKEWVWFYDDSGERVGQVRNGSTWVTIGGKIFLDSWVPYYDLDQADSTTRCNNHIWDHDEEKYHCHMFEEHGHVIAVFFENMKYQVSGYESMKSVPDPSGEVYPQNGNVITIVGAFTVP